MRLKEDSSEQKLRGAYDDGRMCALYLQTANRQRYTALVVGFYLYRRCFRTAHNYADVSGIYVVIKNLYRTPSLVGGRFMICIRYAQPLAGTLFYRVVLGQPSLMERWVHSPKIHKESVRKRLCSRPDLYKRIYRPVYG